MTPVRVLVVDDSALMRKMIPQLLSSDPCIEVVGTAMDGIFCLNKIETLKPDVITLDISMPRMDGIEALRHIIGDFGIPTIVVSSLTRENAELTFRALEMGAFDFVTKPQDSISLSIHSIASDLIEKVKAASRARPIPARPAEGLPPRAYAPKVGTVLRPSDAPLLAMGVSTGGPNALSYLLPLLPPDFPAAIVIVQHMPPGFTGMFAARLNALSSLEVKEARDGDLVVPGRALIAPGDRHLKVKRMPLGTIAVLSDGPPQNGHRPSADVLFRSAAEEYGARSVGLIMTGMGSDGAEGIGEIQAAGGLTLAQDEDSCVVFGMPKAAMEKGHISRTVSLCDMGDFLISRFDRKENTYGTVRC